MAGLLGHLSPQGWPWSEGHNLPLESALYAAVKFKVLRFLDLPTKSQSWKIKTCSNNNVLKHKKLAMINCRRIGTKTNPSCFLLRSIQLLFAPISQLRSFPDVTGWKQQIIWHHHLYGGFLKWWYPQNKTIIFCRKTNGCWVPAF